MEELTIEWRGVTKSVKGDKEQAKAIGRLLFLLFNLLII